MPRKGRWAALLCAAIVWMHASVASAATHFIRYGARDGLPSQIDWLEVDARGVLWMATNDGLVEFDGRALRFRRGAPGAADGLPDNDLVAVVRGSDDRLWLASQSHLSVLDRERRTLVEVRFAGPAAACDDGIVSLLPDDAGGIWLVGHGRALCRIDRDGRARQLLTPQERQRLPDVLIWIVPLSPDVQLLGTESGLFLRDGRGVRAVAPERLGDRSIFAMSRDPDGTVWVGTDRELFALRWSARDGPVLSPSPWRLPKGTGNVVLMRDRGGGYWMGTTQGLYHADGRNAPLTKVRGDPNDDGLSSGVFAQIEDAEGGLWFASYSQGLSYLPPEHARFEAQVDVAGVRMDVADPVAAEPDGAGGFWVAVSHALHAVPARADGPVLQASSSALGLGWLLSVSRCEDGRLWMATYDRVAEYDPAAGRVLRTLRFPFDSNRVPQRALCVGDDVWVSFYGGDVQVHARDGRLRALLSARETEGDRNSRDVIAQRAPDGRPWIAGSRALLRWDGRRFQRFELPGFDAVDAFAFDDAGEIWVAGNGRVAHYVFAGGALRLRARYGSDEGLPPVAAAHMLVEGGQIWLATSRGLLQFDPAQARARLYGMRDGLPGLDFSIAAPVRAGPHLALAMSKQGWVRFDPRRPLPPPRASMLSFDALEFRRDEDRVALPTRNPGEPRIELAPGDRDLRVVVRLETLGDPAAHRFQFRLRGFDPDWVSTEDRGERAFSALPPGHYLLDVRGANADGIWSPVRRVRIDVLAPWWRRGWAFALYAALLAAVAWLGARLQRRRIERRHAYRLARQRRELAEQASQAKSAFLANLGHEVRTPMTGVLGMSELLLSAPLAPAQQAQVQAIRRAGEHLLRLVNDALDLTRIEAGRLELDRAPFDPRALVEDAVALMRPLALRKALRFDVVVEDGVPPALSGDATRVRQILLNLLGNAIKFTERGEVALRLAALSPQGLRIEVLDTGPGLDAEQQRRLFRRYEQADGARTASRYGGSGLGLAICQDLAVAMGGGIALRSAPGEGACFIVRLPLPQTARAEDPRRAATRFEALSARHVLLVEDDAIVADALSGLLQAQGHCVVHAGHALAALTEVATHRFDIAFVDLDLPGMDGCALVRQLRAQGVGIALVAISARADADAEAETAAAGFDGFLRKPLTAAMLGDALRAHARDADAMPSRSPSDSMHCADA